jgi:hypothetical protein
MVCLPSQADVRPPLPRLPSHAQTEEMAPWPCDATCCNDTDGSDRTGTRNKHWKQDCGELQITDLTATRVRIEGTRRASRRVECHHRQRSCTFGVDELKVTKSKSTNLSERASVGDLHKDDLISSRRRYYSLPLANLSRRNEVHRLSSLPCRRFESTV